MADGTLAFQSGDLARRHPPELETFRGGIDQRRRIGGYIADGAVLHALARFHGEQIFALGAHEVGAVNRKQRLSSSDVLIGRVREYLLDPSCETRLHVALETFVGLNVAGGLEAVA